MCDVYKSSDVAELLAGKHVAVLGGSVMRGLYKDLVWLLNDDSFIPAEVLGDKSEDAFPRFDGKRWEKSGRKASKRVVAKFSNGNTDTLLHTTGLHAGRTYVEPRRYVRGGLTINYIFTSKVWHDELDVWLRSYARENSGRHLDLVILNR